MPVKIFALSTFSMLSLLESNMCLYPVSGPAIEI